MKCIICGASAEAVEIETGFSHPDKRKAAEDKAREQAEALSQWEHMRVTITRDGGQLELVAGDVCPTHKLQPGAVYVAVK